MAQPDERAFDVEENDELTDEELRAASGTDDDVTSRPEDEDPESLVEGDDLTDEEELLSLESPDSAVQEGFEELRGAGWHLAPSLVRLRAEINKRWPRRDKGSDGSIGDASHSARASDHNPNGRRSVNAIDIDKDGVVPSIIVNAAKKHPACNYIIWNRVIYSRSRGFRGKRYTGPNPHTHHIHVSLRQARDAEQSTRSWGIASGASTPAPTPSKPSPARPVTPTVKAPAWLHGPDDYYRFYTGTPPAKDGVRMWQTQMKKRGWDINTDGRFGQKTLDVVKAFQREKGLPVDGLIGPRTWRAAWEAKVT